MAVKIMTVRQTAETVKTIHISQVTPLWVSVAAFRHDIPSQAEIREKANPIPQTSDKGRIVKQLSVPKVRVQGQTQGRVLSRHTHS